VKLVRGRPPFLPFSRTAACSAGLVVSSRATAIPYTSSHFGWRAVTSATRFLDLSHALNLISRCILLAVSRRVSAMRCAP
jgi:hypothetical protein